MNRSLVHPRKTEAVSETKACIDSFGGSCITYISLVVLL